MADENLTREILQRLTTIEVNTSRLPKIEMNFEKMDERLDVVCHSEAINTEFRQKWQSNFKWAWRVIIGSLLTSLGALLAAIFLKGGAAS